MGILFIPVILLLLGAGVFVLLIYVIIKRIDSKKKETFEKRDY